MSNNCCGSETKLLYACSGTSDVGEIADRAARILWSEGFAQRACLAGIGAGIPGFLKSAEGAGVNITIDGCKIACAKKGLEKIGVKPESYILADFGLEKGKTPVIDETVNKVCLSIKEKRASTEKSSGSGCSCC